MYEQDLFNRALCSSKGAFFKRRWEKSQHRQLKTKHLGKLRHVRLSLECEGSISSWLVYQREVKR